MVENAERILAIELMAAAEGLEYRRPLQQSVETERARRALRAWVPPLEEDRALSHDIEALTCEIRQGGLDEWAA